MAGERAREVHLTRTLARPLSVTLVLILLSLAPGISRAQAGADSLLLHWTAPGDDGTLGTAAAYEIRFATSPLDASTFAQAALVPQVPAPAPSSTQQTLRVRGLTRGTSYWFAMRARDAAGNWSDLSNVLRWDWPLDASPPSTPTSLHSTLQPDGKGIRVYWSANADPDLMGYYIYRATHSVGIWQRLNRVPVAQPSYIDTDLPADLSSGLDYAVTAVDVNANESARSAPITVSFAASQPASLTGWSFAPPYPNPSRVDDAVRLPLSLPPGAGEVRIEIRDGNDLLVRRLDVSDAAGGRREVLWDGRNAAGRTCAPGVYRAALVATGFQRTVRIARVP